MGTIYREQQWGNLNMKTVILQKILNKKKKGSKRKQQTRWKAESKEGNEKVKKQKYIEGMEKVATIGFSPCEKIQDIVYFYFKVPFILDLLFLRKFFHEGFYCILLKSKFIPFHFKLQHIFLALKEKKKII